MDPMLGTIVLDFNNDDVFILNKYNFGNLYFHFPTGMTIKFNVNNYLFLIFITVLMVVKMVCMGLT